MLDFTRFKILTFDCYGTMIDWESGIFSALRPILDAHHKQMSDAALLELYSELEAEAEQGKFQRYREVLGSVVRGFGARLGFSPTEAEIRSLPESLANWQPFPDTIAALRKLKERYQLAVISNIDDDMFAASAAKLGVTFDQVITAQQAACYKPGLKIFAEAGCGHGLGKPGVAACGSGRSKGRGGDSGLGSSRLEHFGESVETPECLMVVRSDLVVWCWRAGSPVRTGPRSSGEQVFERLPPLNSRSKHYLKVISKPENGPPFSDS